MTEERNLMLDRPLPADARSILRHTCAVDTLDPWPPADPLAEALHFLRMNGAFYCCSKLTAPWGLTLPPMPGYLWFHVVTAGRVWLEADQTQAVVHVERVGDDLGGDLDVLSGRQGRNEVEELEDEAHRVAAEGAQLALRGGREFPVPEPDAADGRLVEPTAAAEGGL